MTTPVKAYEDLRSEFQSGRELEASVLLRAAHKLEQCAKNWAEKDTRQFTQQLDEAVQFNQRLWTLIQVEMANPENPLPQETRRNLVQLSRYIDQKMLGLCAGGELKDLKALAKINQEIAAGLLTLDSSAKPQPYQPQQEVEEDFVIDVTT